VPGETPPAQQARVFSSFLDGNGIGLKPVIDGHAHVGPAWNLPRRLGPAGSLLSVMDRLGIDVSCISGLRALAGDLRGGNDDVLDALRVAPDRFVGAAVFNPHYGLESSRELQRMFAQGGVGMIKVHPGFHSYPLDGAGYDSVWRFASERRIPVLAHTWAEGKGYDHPNKAARVAAAFPSFPLVLAHAGGDRDGIYAAADVAVAFPNIYLDLASSLVYRGMVRHLIEAVGAHRLLFGTDAVYLAGPPQVARVLASVTMSEATLILGRNILTILESCVADLPAIRSVAAQ
jgi:uncharacterized protein